jgi:hypothetical protein
MPADASGLYACPSDYCSHMFYIRQKSMSSSTGNVIVTVDYEVSFVINK